MGICYLQSQYHYQQNNLRATQTEILRHKEAIPKHIKEASFQSLLPCWQTQNYKFWSDIFHIFPQRLTTLAYNF